MLSDPSVLFLLRLLSSYGPIELSCATSVHLPTLVFAIHFRLPPTSHRPTLRSVLANGVRCARTTTDRYWE